MKASTTGAELESLVREHAALRRVATLVASEPPRAEVFAAVPREAGTLLGGHVDIHSPLGQGTRLRARLPTSVLGSLGGR
jgi:hypothetical protein